ncbi:MAG: hypothetical protein HKO77_10925 [Gemmatimonadetes bacterium]|nr:hypothetical protein [Gemmatimonadota bacterium]NNL31530.1 hypothetical protein [Gemmatimonadota bacterium]
MHRFRSLLGVFAVGVLVLVAGCDDAPFAPHVDLSDPEAGLLGAQDDLAEELLGLTGAEVTVLERAEPLARTETASRTIGSWGGVIRLPEAGLTVLVPRGALRSRTSITVTAPAGALVGYHFEPHGLEFRRPVTLVQDITLTSLLNGRALLGAYFQGPLEPTVTALEILPLYLTQSSGAIRIDHFSGYVIATN